MCIQYINISTFDSWGQIRGSISWLRANQKSPPRGPVRKRPPTREPIKGAHLICGFWHTSNKLAGRRLISIAAIPLPGSEPIGRAYLTWSCLGPLATWMESVLGRRVSGTFCGGTKQPNFPLHHGGGHFDPRGGNTLELHWHIPIIYRGLPGLSLFCVRFLCLCDIHGNWWYHTKQAPPSHSQLAPQFSVLPKEMLDWNVGSLESNSVLLEGKTKQKEGCCTKV